MILEDGYKLQVLFLFQRVIPLLVGDKHLLRLFVAHQRHRHIVQRRFDDDFMRSDTIHFAEKARLLHNITVFTRRECGKAVGHHPDFPGNTLI